MPNAFHLLNAGQMQLYHQNSLNSPSTPTQLTANAPTGSASAAAAALAATLGNLGNLGNLNHLGQLAAVNSMLPMNTSLPAAFNAAVSSASGNPFNLASLNAAGLGSPLAMAAAAAPVSPDYQTSLTGDSKRFLQSLTAGLAGQLSALAAQQSVANFNARSTTTVSSTSTCTSPSVSAVDSSHSLASDQYSSHYTPSTQGRHHRHPQSPMTSATSCTSPLIEDSRTLAAERKSLDFSSGMNAGAASLLTGATAPNLGLLNELLAFYDVRKMYENLPYLNALYPALLANSAGNNNHNNNNNLHHHHHDHHTHHNFTSTPTQAQPQRNASTMKSKSSNGKNIFRITFSWLIQYQS
jgi:hypothetical protein